MAKARSIQAANETYIFNQKLSGKIDSMSYSLQKKLRSFTKEGLFIQMPIIKVNTGIMNEIFFTKAYQIWWTISASGLKVSELESHCTDSEQQGEIIILILQMRKKDQGGNVLTDILFESKKLIFFFCYVT